MNWRHFGSHFSAYFASLLIGIFLHLSMSARAEITDTTSQDILGASQSCQIARKEIPAPVAETHSCQVQDPAKKLDTVISEVQLNLAGVTESKLASKEVKKRLIQGAVENFANSVARAKQVTGFDPLESKLLSNVQADMLKQCGDGGSDLKAEADKLLATAKARSFPPTKDNQILNRYLVAMMEFSRIDIAIKDNYVRGEERNKLIARRNKILAFYPMAIGGATGNLKTRLEVDLKTSLHNSRFTGAGPDWLEDYLFKGKPVPADARTTKVSFAHDLAIKLEADTPLSQRVKKEVADAFSTQLLSQMKSLGDLCKADPCSTFNVSHELTVQSLRRRQIVENIYARNLSGEKPLAEKMKFTALQKQVCNCRLLEPQKVFDDGLLTGMSIGTLGGLVFCVFIDPTKLSCPLVAAAGYGLAVGAGVNTIMAAKDAYQVQSAINASENLPGLSSDEKSKITTFQRERMGDVGTDVALTVGGTVAVKVATPLAKVGIAKVKNKFGKKTAAGEHVEHRGTGEVEDHVVGERNANRQHYVDNYSEAVGTTTAERAKFKAMEKTIKDAAKAGKPLNVIARSVENSIQKFLNSITNDFAFVNAINNRRDAIFRAKLKNYLDENPGLKMEFSTDWKGMHTIAHGDIPAGYNSDLSRIINETYKELSSDLVGAGLMRMSDRELLLNEMNHSGYGRTFDEAGAARKMDKEMTPNRSQFEGHGGRDYHDPDVLENHRVRYEYTEQFRRDLEAKIGDTPLMVLEPASGKKVPIRSLYTTLKASDDPKVLQKAIKSNHGVDVDENTAAKLKELSRLANDQSPNLVPAVHRDSATLVGADYGGISSDTIAMNTRNSDATLRGVARAKNSNDSLITIREEEAKVTKWLDETVNPNYREIAKKTVTPKETLISGDEKKAVLRKPTTVEKAKSYIFGKPINEDKLKHFVREHAADDPGLQRHTYIPPGVPPAMRDPLSEHGHTIQKYLMEVLEQRRVLSLEKLENMNGLIVMETTSINKGGVSIIVGQRPGTPKFNLQDRNKIEDAMQEAIERFNKATSEKPKTAYKKARLVLADE